MHTLSACCFSLTFRKKFNSICKLICSRLLLSFGKSLYVVLDRFAWLVDRKLDLHHRVRHFNWFSGIDFVDKLFFDRVNFARCLFSIGFHWDINYCKLAHMLLGEFILRDQNLYSVNWNLLTTLLRIFLSFAASCFCC